MHNLIIIFSLFFCYSAAAPQFKHETCGGKPADIYFLLDSSSSIWVVDYRKQLRFVNDVIDTFEISPDKTRVAVGTFSDRFHPVINLDSYDTKEQLQKAVKDVGYLTGGTNTGEAIKMARERGFDPNVARSGVVQILIVMTDGKSRDSQKTIDEAKISKNAGIFVFAIGVGNGVDINELKKIGSEPSADFVFNVANFDVLDSIKIKLAYKACEVQVTTEAPPQMEEVAICGGRNMADLMFLMDSTELGAAKTKKIYNFVGGLVTNFDMASGNIRAGVMSRNCAENDIRLDEYEDEYELSNALKNSKFPTLSHLLKKTRLHSFKPENGGRIMARHMGVLFIDDKLHNAKEVIAEATNAKKNDVELFVVVIGDKVNADEALELASPPLNRHLLMVPSYDELPFYVEDFIRDLCYGL